MTDKWKHRETIVHIGYGEYDPELPQHSQHPEHTQNIPKTIKNITQNELENIANEKVPEWDYIYLIEIIHNHNAMITSR